MAYSPKHSSSFPGPFIPSVAREIDENTWNKNARRVAWPPAPYVAERSFAVYAVSKKESEWEAWKWCAEREPSFALNAVKIALSAHLRRMIC
ncbi:hypothetical protein VUR80DRAFT_5542 [Thermomyces stellatus]